MLLSGYSIALAETENLSALPEIERHAANLFRGWGVPDSVFAHNTSPETFAEAQRAGLLWLVLSPEQTPVAFALLERLGATLHLQEMDVHPAHGRRGLGTALLRQVFAWAKEGGYRALTLTTYRDIPWNAPFYAKLGFVTLSEAELTADLRARMAQEAALGLALERRVAMSKRLV